MAPAGTPTTPSPSAQDGSIKLTLITIVIAFILTLVFRAFVAEAFLIPTGSMAPSLLGEHLRYRSPLSGYSWASNASGMPTLPAGARAVVGDPSTASYIDTPVDGPRSGDRIFVLKFLGALFAPRRWDVVVFKNPESPDENYIKRLVGLPGESVLLVDGDVFTRPASQPDVPWTIARKPARVQRALWRPIDASHWAPIRVPGTVAAPQPAWIGEHAQIDGRTIHLGASPLAPASGSPDSLQPTRAAIRWDGEQFPIVDEEPYNSPPTLSVNDEEIEHSTERRTGAFPVSDLRLALTIHPEQPLRVRARIDAAGRSFAGDVFTDARGAVLRILQRDDATAEWRSIAERHVADPDVLRPRQNTRIEFTHVDQAIELKVGERWSVRTEYSWDAKHRLAVAASLAPDDANRLFDSGGANAEPLDPGGFMPPDVAWEFESAPGTPLRATLQRVSLDRDVHYRPTRDEYGRPARATHPTAPASLDAGQYFVLGDNSASSRDGRLWEQPDPWVSAAGVTPPGVVTADLLIGKAFFVYFPAPLPARVFGQRHAIVPDVGRMRFIR